MYHPVRPRKRALNLLLVLALCVAFVPVGAAGAIVPPATTWYVDAVNGDNANAGTSAATALQGIQAALNKGAAGDTVVILPGTYDDNGEDWPINITYPVTIVSQDGADVTFIGDEGGHPLFDIDAGPVTIDGLTFQNGMSGLGGAIFCTGAQLSVANCDFTGNTAEAGGAIFFGGAVEPVGEPAGIEPKILPSSLTLEGCTFTGNGNETTASPFGANAVEPTCYEGGAVLALDAVVEIDGCVFEDNGAEYAAPAVFLSGADASVTDTVFEHNQVTYWFNATEPEVSANGLFSKGGISAQSPTAKQAGFEMDAGALAVADSTIEIQGSTFSDNFAFNGAGLAVMNSSFQVSDCTFADNYAFLGALTAQQSFETDTVVGSPDGEISPDFAIIEGSTIERSLFTGTRGGMCGLMLMTLDPVEIRNSLFYGNGIYTEAELAAVPDDVVLPPLMSVIDLEYPEMPFGVVAPKGMPPAEVLNTTIADNNAEFGIVAPYGNASVANTIVWNGIEAGSLLGVSDFTNCDLESEPDAGPARASVEPQPIEPVWFSEYPEFVDPENGDYAIQPWSPCVDTGADLTDMVVDDFNGTARPKDGNEDGTSEWDVGAFEVDPWSDTRIGGMARYETSVEICQRHFPFGSDTVVMATGLKFADGLTGSALAGAYESPLLLTKRDELPTIVADEIVRLGASHIVLLGGADAVDDNVLEALSALAGVEEIERIGGVDRYETAAMIADEVVAIEEAGDGFGGTFFIARGDLFADALTASPVAWANKIPILLVEPGELPAATIDSVEAAAASHAIVLGGEAAVSSRVSGQVAALVGGTERITGVDRYETSANFSEWAVTGGLATWDAVGVATGQNFPDALSGGAGIGSRGGVVLLSPSLTMNTAIEDVLEANGGSVVSLEVFGGEAAVSADVFEALMALVNVSG